MIAKRKMPSKIQIFRYWQNKMIDSEDIDLNVCWGCGFTAAIERCHIHDRCYSLNDNVSNLVLLCKDCHRHQESMCGTENGRIEFVEKLINGAFLMNYRIESLCTKIKYNLYDNVLIELGYTNKQIEDVKKILI
jgi:hypothetical protein